MYVGFVLVLQTGGGGGRIKSGKGGAGGPGGWAVGISLVVQQHSSLDDGSELKVGPISQPEKEV